MDSAAATKAFDRAVVHHRAGRLAEAEASYLEALDAQPRHAGALHLLGVIALQTGRCDAAVELIGDSIAIRASAGACGDLGSALKAMGRREEAIAQYRRALSLDTTFAEAWANLGDALAADDVDEAEACCRRAIALKPQLVEGHVNLGNALLLRHAPTRAVDAYRQALALNPGLGVVHANLALALQAAGQSRAAIDAGQQALALAAPTASLLACMAQSFRAIGEPGQAIGCQIEALRLDESDATRAGFVQLVRDAHFGTPQPAVRALLIRALDEDWTSTGELLTPAISLVVCEPALSQALARRALAETSIVFDAALAGALVGDGLLTRLMAVDVLPDMALERLFTRLRRCMLDRALDDASEPPAAVVMQAQAVIARQCFVNEYVYALTARDVQDVTRLRDRLLASSARGETPEAHRLVAWAAFAPLSELPEVWSEVTWPDALTGLFIQQQREPRIERSLLDAMAVLTAVVDPVSRGVRSQYEANPYPRWVRAPRSPTADSPEAILRRRFPLVRIDPVPAGAAGPEVLVAGCGTGLHAIEAARRFVGAHVLAVDLSLASLSYARRKTDELAQGGIRYAQADLLELGTLPERFDVVESAGVLHHLADPLAGWSVLAGLLRPGGVMAVALYSELGRRDVVAARRLIAERVWQAEPAGIREARQSLMSEPARFAQFLSSRDFFSTSACRDLLFHVQEQRFTMPRLKDALPRVGLRLLGFAVDPAVNAAYDLRFPDDPSRTNLDHWHVFETDHPDTFRTMYSMWLQKPA